MEKRNSSILTTNMTKLMYNKYEIIVYIELSFLVFHPSLCAFCFRKISEALEGLEWWRNKNNILVRIWRWLDFLLALFFRSFRIIKRSSSMYTWEALLEHKKGKWWEALILLRLPSHLNNRRRRKEKQTFTLRNKCKRRLRRSWRKRTLIHYYGILCYHLNLGIYI